MSSNCCYAEMFGEPANNYLDNNIIEGRCSDCKEMAVFNDEELENE